MLCKVLPVTNCIWYTKQVNVQTSWTMLLDTIFVVPKAFSIFKSANTLKKKNSAHFVFGGRGWWRCPKTNFGIGFITFVLLRAPARMSVWPQICYSLWKIHILAIYDIKCVLWNLPHFVSHIFYIWHATPCNIHMYYHIKSTLTNILHIITLKALDVCNLNILP
jgi:hypothetical protein